MFASCSLVSMVTTPRFLTVTAFCYLMASMVMLTIWSLGLACMDAYAITRKKDLCNPVVVIILVVGDWLIGMWRHSEKTFDAKNWIECLLDALVSDLLIRASPGGNMMYDVDTVLELLKEFVVQAMIAHTDPLLENDYDGIKKHRRSISDASKGLVAKLVDSYLAEVSQLLQNQSLVIETLHDGPSHDGLYCSIDMYLKAYPGISKGEKKKICRLMDCNNLSADACSHAVQNQRLPL